MAMRFPPLCCAILAMFLAGPTAAQDTPPSEPIAEIVRMLEERGVVALGEGAHNNEQGHAFRLALLRDRRFAEAVDDIVVEFGNALYQPVMDRFVGGEHVPAVELKQVWQNTSQPNAVWDVPIYEEFFRAVRDLNAALPAEQRIRVLLGDPPIDWSGVTRFADIFAQMRRSGDRDSYPAKLIEREVIARDRRALVIYGDQHLTRTPAELRPGCQAGSTIPCYPGSIVDQLEHAIGERVFTITTVTDADLATLDKSAAQWSVPMLAVLSDTPLGATSYRSFLPAGPLMIGPDGQAQPEPPSVLRPIEQVFDAALYIGPPATITLARLPRELCTDQAYLSMRAARLAMVPGGPGILPCGP